MPGQGPPPNAKRRRRNADPNPTTVVAADGESAGPDLPEREEPWHPRTVAWWATWRSSAQAKAFIGTDWDVLLETALLHDAFWRGDVKVAAELRLRVAQFGATPADRMRLRMTIEDPSRPAAVVAPGRVTDIAARRARLSG